MRLRLGRRGRTRRCQSKRARNRLVQPLAQLVDHSRLRLDLLRLLGNQSPLFIKSRAHLVERLQKRADQPGFVVGVPTGCAAAAVASRLIKRPQTSQRMWCVPILDGATCPGRHCGSQRRGRRVWREAEDYERIRGRSTGPGTKNYGAGPRDPQAASGESPPGYARTTSPPARAPLSSPAVVAVAVSVGLLHPPQLWPSRSGAGAPSPTPGRC